MATTTSQRGSLSARAAQSITSATTGRARHPAARVGGERRGVDDRLAVEQIERRAWPAIAAVAGDVEHQPAVAAAELEDSQRRGDVGLGLRVSFVISVDGDGASERAGEDAARAHERIDAAQVAPRPLRDRVVRREVVERLGLERARQHHSTRSSAPWQLKPAPNDDSHHHPAGASSAIAAARTK